MFRNPNSRYLRGCLALWLAAVLSASEHHGLVKFGGMPVPGAAVTAAQGDKTQVTVTDFNGAYAFPDLSDGTWTLQIEMPGFAPIKQDVAVAPGAPSPEWELKMLSLSEMKATAAPASAPAPAATPQSASPTPTPATAAKPKNNKKNPGPVGPTNTQAAFQRAQVNATGTPAAGDAAPAADSASTSSQSSELSQRAADGLLVNGTQNNGASSPFAINPAFGNGRRGPRSLYNGNIGFTLDNSSLDARPFSLTGQDTARPPYSNFQGLLAFGGPIKIPHLIERNGPNFFVNYQWRRNRTVNSQPGLVPDPNGELKGDFSHFVDPVTGKPIQLYYPTNLAPTSVAQPGTPIPNNVIPQSMISTAARNLLAFFPAPNFTSPNYNYQIPLVNNTHQDSLQARINKTIGRRNQVSGTFAMQDTRSDSPNLFGFLDTNRSLGMNAIANWRHTFSQRFFSSLGVQYSRQAIRLHPYFENLPNGNISSSAGILGNNQDPLNWGPPTLSFASGIASLSDGVPSFTRNQTAAISSDNYWNRGRHQFQFGGELRRQQINLLSQQNPRGSFTFTGAATNQSGLAGAGYDFAGFLLGVPDLSSISYDPKGPDRYFRDTVYGAYFNDEWKISPGLTLNIGLRWDYWSPITEKYGRLVNLDIVPGFSAATPVCATIATGCTPANSKGFPDSLVNPDKHEFQPRAAFAWRPFPASSMVVRGGYGIYYNTSVYQTIASQMAQQSPLSYSFTSNNANTPLTLAQGFIRSQAITANTFAIDPNFRVGYSQNWYLSIQRDLPGSLVMIARYDGVKGTHNPLEFYPNTYPTGPSGPTGFLYMTSVGNAERQAGMLQLRRRLHNGFTATLQYTFAKAIDDGVVGGGSGGVQLAGAPGAAAGPAVPSSGVLVAQNWLNLRADRGLSAFDQRHNVSLQLQYTTGMGIGGGTLLKGWRGALFKQWTFLTNTIAGTGFPLTPVYPAALLGTGVNGTIRPNYTGAPLYAAPGGLFLNPAAYTAPAPGQWGNAGRNTITGPAQFSFNASMARTFTLNDRFSLDVRVDAQNVLNHVTFSSWNTTVTNLQFGLPTTGAANGMRVLQTNVRLRF